MSCPESQDECCPPGSRTKAAYFVGAIAVFLIVAGLVKTLRHYTETGAQAAREARATERSKAQLEVRQAAAQDLTTVGVVNKEKAFYRIPVTAAMELTVQDYQTPRAAKAARAEFNARVDKANAAPPKPPEKKSEFE